MSRNPGQFRSPYDGLPGALAAAGRTISQTIIAEATDVISPKAAPFNAVGDGVADDSAAIQAAVNAAEALGRPAVVDFGSSRYMVQDPTTGAHNGASDGPIRISSSARKVSLVGNGAELIVGARGIGTSAVRLFGSQCRLHGINVNCNAGVAQANKANSGIEVNGTGDGITGSDNNVQDVIVYNGIKADNLVTQAEECFVAINAFRNRFHNCWAMDAAWQAFKIGQGGGNRIEVCWALNHRGNGLRVQGAMEDLFVDGFTSRSDRNSGRHAIIIDPASSGSTSRLRRAFLRGLDLYNNPTVEGDVPYGDGPTDGSCNVLKIAAVGAVYISQSKIGTGTGLSNRSFRLEDGVGKVVFDHCEFDGPGCCTESAASGESVYQGQPSAQASGTGGKVRFTLGSGHGLILGKSLYIHGSAIPSYNREHIIQEVDATTVTTDVAYVAGSLGANIWANSGVDQAYFRDCRFDHTRTTGGIYHIFTAAARRMAFERCDFTALVANAAKQAGIGWNVANDLGFELLRLVDTHFLFNSSNFVKGVKPLSESGMLRTGGKTIGLRSSCRNLGSGTAMLVDQNNAGDSATDYPNRATLFNSDGDRTGAYLGTAKPTGTDIAFQRGERIHNTTPSDGGPPGFVCTASGSAGVSVGTWKNEANLEA